MTPEFFVTIDEDAAEEENEIDENEINELED